LKVLLVDDEEEMVTALAERLSLRDIEADWVTCGVDAISRARQNRYDVFVLDVKMPGMSGLEIMEKIQEIKPDAKIIFLTGHGSVEDHEAGKRAGASFYLMKPLDIQVLIDRMREATVAGGRDHDL
jgi:DNA-binding response OmpR family regulator